VAPAGDKWLIDDLERRLDLRTDDADKPGEGVVLSADEAGVYLAGLATLSAGGGIKDDKYDELSAYLLREPAIVPAKMLDSIRHRIDKNPRPLVRIGSGQGGATVDRKRQRDSVKDSG
jgi:hypothetical protein